MGDARFGAFASMRSDRETASKNGAPRLTKRSDPKSATACDLARRLVGTRSTRFRWVVQLSFDGGSLDQAQDRRKPRIDAMGNRKSLAFLCAGRQSVGIAASRTNSRDAL